MRSKFPLSILLCFLVCFSMAARSQSSVKNQSLDSLKIVFFGSSVPFGFGAKKDRGYTYMFTDILNKRAADGTGKKWKTANISKGGDNTVRLTQRWKKELVPQKAKYVVYALSLGNEMIHEQGGSKLTQFENNMVKLIALARDSGYVPILTNCYTRNDFNAKDYGYIKQLNAWINKLDVPSVNLLGGIDDGTGKWAPGNWFNPGHPNDAGYQELAYTIVPSLFDALSNGKPKPKWADGPGIPFKSQEFIVFKPDNITHPFTTTVTIKADGKGRIMQLKDSIGNVGALTITDKGCVTYTSPQYQEILGTTKITDGQWHKVTLTHYYARNQTLLYCDATLQGSVAERLFIKELHLGDKNISAKNWFFFRAGMNADEVAALANNELLKSSLELYAPLDDKNKLINLAQSTNTIWWVK